MSKEDVKEAECCGHCHFWYPVDEFPKGEGGCSEGNGTTNETNVCDKFKE